METILTLIIIQAFIGAYDTIYHHDLREGLPFRPTAALELKIHSMRSFLYSVMFFTLAWAQPLGAFAVLFAAIIAIEIGLTFWDFVVEDQTRVLPLDRIPRQEYRALTSQDSRLAHWLAWF